VGAKRNLTETCARSASAAAADRAERELEAQGFASRPVAELVRLGTYYVVGFASRNAFCCRAAMWR